MSISWFTWQLDLHKSSGAANSTLAFTTQGLCLKRLHFVSRRHWELGGLAALEEADEAENARYKQSKAIREKIADPEWRPWRYVTCQLLDFRVIRKQLPTTCLARLTHLNVSPHLACNSLLRAPRPARCFLVAERKCRKLRRAKEALGGTFNSIWTLRRRLWVQAAVVGTNHHRPIHLIRLRGSALAQLRSDCQEKRMLTQLRLQTVNLCK